MGSALDALLSGTLQPDGYEEACEELARLRAIERAAKYLFEHGGACIDDSSRMGPPIVVFPSFIDKEIHQAWDALKDALGEKG